MKDCNEQETDLLVGRVINRTDSPGDWREMDALAGHDESVFDEVIAALRDDATLRSVVQPRLTCVERVEVPAPRGHFELLKYAGWAAAVLIAASWLGSWLWPKDEPLPAASHNVIKTTAVTDKAKSSGDVLAELPSTLLEARPLPGGGTEVLMVRRHLERIVVKEAWQVATDDGGSLTTVKADLTRFAPATDF